MNAQSAWLDPVVFWGVPLAWLLSAFGSAAVLSRHDKAGIGCLLGILLGPIGLITAIIMQRKTALPDSAPAKPASAFLSKANLAYLIIVVGLAIIALPEAGCEFSLENEQALGEGITVTQVRTVSPWLFRLSGAAVLGLGLVLRGFAERNRPERHGRT